MKAIKDCEWRVEIHEVSWKGFYWDALTDDIAIDFNMTGYLPNESMTQENFIEFAKVNGITKYKFI